MTDFQMNLMCDVWPGSVCNLVVTGLDESLIPVCVIMVSDL